MWFESAVVYQLFDLLCEGGFITLFKMPMQQVTLLRGIDTILGDVKAYQLLGQFILEDLFAEEMVDKVDKVTRGKRKNFRK